MGAKASGTDIMLQVSPVAESVHLVHHTKPVKYKLPLNAEQLPSITVIDPDGTVHFENGEARNIDDIILCTGYEYYFPFLTHGCGVWVEFGKHVAPLYKHVLNIAHPSMAFIGLNTQILPFPLFDMQVQFVVSTFAGETQLPTKKDMALECETRYKWRLEQGFSPRHAHSLENQFPYIEELVRMANLKPLPNIYEQMYNDVKKDRESDALNYRKYDYVVREINGGKLTFAKYLRPGKTLVF